ncbi:MAG: endoribonuclease YbeY [Alphaproteobacteria bacterium]|nr:MAG: endoribonuclease YbeY [Alphaproteobacteria bacterium]
MTPRIDIAVDAGAWPDKRRLRTIARRAVAAGFAAGDLCCADGSELSLLCTDDARMRSVNRRWRGIDKPTNVLSFPGGAAAPGATAGPVLGDIVLSQETIAREAALDGKPFEHHLTHMIVHGLLHLFGYDHMDDGGAREMETIERRALASLGIDDPYAGH